MLNQVQHDNLGFSNVREEFSDLKREPLMKKKLPFTCPVCGRKTEYPIAKLVEGASLTCPFCTLTLTLHGHMWEEVKREIKKLVR